MSEENVEIVKGCSPSAASRPPAGSKWWWAERPASLQSLPWTSRRSYRA